mgnify:CR=1 FL=1
MVNVFKLYKQPEDHFTNGLFGILQLMHVHERKSFDEFLSNVMGFRSKLGKSANFKFQVPAEESRPDALMEDASHYVLFESKIRSGTLDRDQVKRHLKSMKNIRKRKILVLLTPDDSTSGYVEKFKHINKDIVHVQWKKVYEFFSLQTEKTKECVLKELMTNFNRAIEDQIVSQDFSAVILRIDFGESGVCSDTYLDELKDGDWKNWHTPREYKQLNGQGRKLLFYDKKRHALTAEVEIEQVSLNYYRKKQGQKYIWNNKINMDSVCVYKNAVSIENIRKIEGLEGFAKGQSAIRNLTRSQYEEIMSLSRKSGK